MPACERLFVRACVFVRVFVDAYMCVRMCLRV